MRDILVSVIIPVYNSEKFLYDALYGIINQTLSNIEIICIDDGSNDNSGIILQEFAAKDSRIHVIYQDNKGAGTARNVGLSIARGKYLSFLDSDDLFEENMLEKAYTAGEKHGADFVIFGADAFSDITGRKMSSEFILRTEQIPESDVFSIKDMTNRIFTFSFNVAWNKLYRREFIISRGIKFQEIYSNNDCFFTCAALVSAARICCVKDVLLHYRKEIAGQLSQYNKISLTNWNMLSAFEKIYSFIAENELYSDIVQNFAEYTISNLIGRLERSGSREDAELRALITDYWIPKLGVGRRIFRHNADYLKYQSFLNPSFISEFFLKPKIVVKPMYVPPYIPDITESGIVLYGAGTAGLDIFLQLKHVALWVDTNAKVLRKKGYPVHCPNEILNTDYSYILVAVAQSNLSFEIKKQLMDMNIPEDKIIGAWGRRFY